jgi:hypothetical protein
MLAADLFSRVQVARILDAGIVIYFIAVLRELVVDMHKYQWDFKTYYYAGLAHADGLNPYFLRSLSAAAGEEVGFPFVYAPTALPFTIVLTAMDFRTAYLLFLAAKGMAAIALIALWRTRFLAGQSNLLFLPFVVFGFGSAMYADFVAGNISILEQLVLWIGFYALLRGRHLAFSLLLISVSLFKVLPIVFAVAFLVVHDRPNYRHFAGTIVGFSAIQLMALMSRPDLYGSFLSSVSKLGGGGIDNPASRAFIGDMAAWLRHNGISVPANADLLVYVGLAVIGLALAGLAISRARRAGVSSEAKLLFLCLTFAVLAPRMKDYSYILVILPGFYFLTRREDLPFHHLVILLPMLSRRLPIPFDSLKPLAAMFWDYYPLIIAILVWIVAVRLLSRRPAVGAEAAEGGTIFHTAVSP